MITKSVHIRVDALTTKTVARRITLLPISTENFVVKLTKNSNVALIALQVKSTLANVMDLDLAGRVPAARIMISKSVHIKMDALTTIESRLILLL
jgi:PIN domain nuclease of toxin-antitoxin system